VIPDSGPRWYETPLWFVAQASVYAVVVTLLRLFMPDDMGPVGLWRLVELLRKEEGRSLCEFKGIAEYMSIIVGDRIAPRAAWAYMAPLQAYAAITGYIAFYPSRVDSCFVGTERVVAQQGDFYGGWITSTIRGPFKGGPGSASW